MSPNSIWSQYLMMNMRKWWKSRRRLYLYDDKLIPERKRWQLQLNYLNRENVACACPVSRSTLPFIFWPMCQTPTYMFHNLDKHSTAQQCACTGRMVSMLGYQLGFMNCKLHKRIVDICTAWIGPIMPNFGKSETDMCSRYRAVQAENCNYQKNDGRLKKETAS